MNTIYISCKQLTTSYKIWVKLAQILNNKNQFEQAPIPNVGWPDSQLISFILKCVQERKLNLLLILDEVDVIAKNEGETLIWNMAELDLTLNPDINAAYDITRGHITVIMISNDPLLRFTDPLNARLSNKLSVYRYMHPDLMKLAEYYAKLSLREGTYTSSDCATIAKFIYEISGSARDLKQLIYLVAETSQNRGLPKINTSTEFLENLMHKVNNEFYTEKITNLPEHQKYVLRALTKVWRFYNVRSENSTHPPLPTIKKIIGEYTEICLAKDEKPRSVPMIRNYLEYLKRIGLITYTTMGKGRGRGAISVFQSLIPEHIEI